MDRYADPDYLTGQMLSALCNSRRRIFIRYARAHDPVELRDIAHVIAEIQDCSQKSAYTSLYQTHTDKLSTAQIIEQADGTKTYTKGPNFAVACQILNYADNL